MGLRQPWARPTPPGQHGRVREAQGGASQPGPLGVPAEGQGRRLGGAGCVSPCRRRGLPAQGPHTPEMAWTATRRKPFTSPFSLTMATRCTRGTGYSRLLRYTKALRGEAASAPAQRVGDGAGDSTAELVTRHCKAELSTGRPGSRRGAGRGCTGRGRGPGPPRGAGRQGQGQGAERGPHLLAGNRAAEEGLQPASRRRTWGPATRV